MVEQLKLESDQVSGADALRLAIKNLRHLEQTTAERNRRGVQLAIDELRIELAVHAAGEVGG